MTSALGSDPRPRAELSGQPARRSAHAGFTLMELLVVLTIVGVVSGLSIGVYRKVSLQNILPASASEVSSVLRAARNFSVSSGLPSRVYIDAETETISAFGYELVASWSFEDLEERELDSVLERGETILGAFREPAEAQGLIEVMNGRVGRGLWFADEGASLVAPRRPRYDAPRGFSLEAWVLFNPQAPSRVNAWNELAREDLYAVISRPGSWEFGLRGDASVYAMLGDADRPNASTTFFASTASGQVLGSRWVHVRASFDGLELTLEVDGIAREWRPEGFEGYDPRDWPPLPEAVEPSEAELMISHPRRMFIGGIDEVKVRVALEPMTARLPSEVAFVGNSRLIRFDSRGALDPIFHSRPVLVRIGEWGDVEFEEEEEGEGGTVVVNPAPTPEEEEAAAREEADAEIEDLLGDPVAAIASYLEAERLAAEEGLEGDEILDVDPEFATPGEGDPDAAATEQGMRRIHQIIIDLTGTIRG